MSKQIEIPFNKWSDGRLRAGQKVCTSRHKRYGDSGDYFYTAGGRFRLQKILELPLWFVRDYLYTLEGAETPEEFQAVWKSLHRGKFKAPELVWVHFFFNPHRIPLMRENIYEEGVLIE